MNLEELKELRDKELAPLSFSLSALQNNQQTIVGAISGAGSRHVVLQRSESRNENTAFAKATATMTETITGAVNGVPSTIEMMVQGGWVAIEEAP